MHSSRHVFLTKDAPLLHRRLQKVIDYPGMPWLAVALWMGAIFALSAVPSLASPFESRLDFILRKLVHIVEYAILTALLFWALRQHVACNTSALLIAVSLTGTAAAVRL